MESNLANCRAKFIEISLHLGVVDYVQCKEYNYTFNGASLQSLAIVKLRPFLIYEMDCSEISASMDIAGFEVLTARGSILYFSSEPLAARVLPVGA